MRNLSLWETSSRNLKIESDGIKTICYGHDETSSSGDLYICSHNLVVGCYNENGEIKWKKDLLNASSPVNSPVNLTYLTLPNSLCVGLENGELFTIRDSGNVCDLVGVFDIGLLAMEWSPDQEQLVLVTKNMKTILMSYTFDPISEVDLLSQEFGEKQFITVGWGKKETQFHGSEGKQAAKVKAEIKGDTNTTSVNTVKITWRGDGNLYAVGFTMDGIRRFKVFDREGQLQYTSEKQQGLETNLSWRPSGNVIATTQKIKEQYVVAFFEKNGLKHGGFTIPVNATTCVEELAWSSDSEILTLQCKDTNTNSQKLLLFTSGNYHWYLKQTLAYNPEQRISKIMWDNDFDIVNNKKLHVILDNGEHYSYSWIWNVDHSKGKHNDDDAIVTVIDGKKILATGFRQNVVPPPMAATELLCESYVNSIHFAPNISNDEHIKTNNFFVCTTDHKLVFYEQTQKSPLTFKEFKTLQLNGYDFPFQYYNWHWYKHNILVCAMIDNEQSYHLVEYIVNGNTVTKGNVTLLPGAVTRIESHPTDSSSLFLQLSNGEILQYIESVINIEDTSFPIACPKFNLISIEGELFYLGLSHKGNLLINDATVLNNVSSFFVHTHFLLLTTLQHLLLCVELTKSGISAIMEHQKIESDHVYKRKVERGAKLIIAVPNDIRTVFQMPRGNLESIQPRPLSLKIIGEYLNSLKYHEAFDLMRKQRINLNLLYDHNPEKFINDIDVFLESIKNNSWLSLFLSDLENLDVTKTMYSSSYADKKTIVNREIDNKIQKICDIIRIHLLQRSDANSKILPLLTAFVKKNTIQDLETALTLIKELKSQEFAGSKLPVGSDEALKYLLYMVDVNHLFDVALGMYDFDLVLLVANKSQKDPKEYIPMLNELNEMDDNYRKFTINKHLKRFDKAIHCLVKCGPEKYDQLKTFVKYHSLYTEALSLLSPDDDIYKEISDDFGLYLKLKKQFVKAGIIYERASSYEKAVECYKDALEWELAIKLAYSWPKEQFKCLCGDLINGLKEEKRHHEALKIFEQYYGDNEEAIKYAIDNGQYKTALRLCTQYNMNHLKNERLLPTLLDEYKNIQQLIEKNWCDFVKYKERLLVVRENKNKNSLTEHYDPSYINKDSDLYSDAGSTLASSSRGSSRSFRSSKNRRKHERKVASLKEGSQYEDVALVMALHNLVTTTFELRLPVKEINTALSCFDKDKEAFILQTLLEKLLKIMKDSFGEIWTNELVIEATNASIAALNIPEGSSVIPQGIASLEPHIRISPVISDVHWKLDDIK
ncbi:elongator complex protein 1 [Aphomia sociella]